MKTFKNKPLEFQATILLDNLSVLGEGAIWDHRGQDFYWIDIEGQQFYRYHLPTKERTTFPLTQRIGTLVPCVQPGQLILALQDGIYQMELDSGKQQLLASPERHLPDNRFNDGKCDPMGRLWVGSMHLEAKENAAALYKIDPGGMATKMLEDITISNGICWSLDGTKMYYIDTPKRNVRSFDYEASTGTIGGEEVLIEIPAALGFPDGMTIDAEGMLWIALWGGAAVGRWNPTTGELLAKVHVPALNVTSCAFGGPDLKSLFITTAQQGMSPTEAANYPQAGALFHLKPGVQGVPAFFFGKQSGE